MGRNIIKDTIITRFHPLMSLIKMKKDLEDTKLLATASDLVCNNTNVRSFHQSSSHFRNSLYLPTLNIYKNQLSLSTLVKSILP